MRIELTAPSGASGARSNVDPPRRAHPPLPPYDWWQGSTRSNFDALLLDAAMIEQLRRAPAAVLREWQQRRLRLMLRYLVAERPVWREYLRGRSDWTLEELPILSRGRLIAALNAEPPSAPPEHGPLFEDRTTGTTGEALRFAVTALAARVQHAHYWSEHRRCGRDLWLSFAGLSGRNPSYIGQHVALPGAPWHGQPGGWLRRVAPHTVLEHAQWLTSQRPHYLTLVGGLWQGLLTEYECGRARPPERLQQVLTYGSPIEARDRERTRALTGALLIDGYSAQECGPVAQQSIDDVTYSVAWTNVIVEIVDDTGRPCAPGTTGRVLVTGLHNWATPLLRYELGDRAVAGTPAPGGLGVAYLERIEGRSLQLLRLPNGDRKLLAYRSEELLDVMPFAEFRLRQVAAERLLFEFVPSPGAAASAAAQADMARFIAGRFPGMDVQVQSVERIAWPSNGKRLPFEVLPEPIA